jgi:hypothetical protein
MPKRNLPEPIWPFLVHVPLGLEDLDLIAGGLAVFICTYALDLVVHGWRAWPEVAVISGFICGGSAAFTHWVVRSTLTRRLARALIAGVVWVTAISCAALDVLLDRHGPHDIPFCMVPFALTFMVTFTTAISISRSKTLARIGFVFGLVAGFLAGFLPNLEDGSFLDGLVLGLSCAGFSGPLGILVGAGLLWLVRKCVEQRCNPLRTFRLDDPCVYLGDDPIERMWALLFLLSIRDGASALRLGPRQTDGTSSIEPGPNASASAMAGDMELSCCVEDRWHFMVPPPRSSVGGLQRWIRKLAGVRLRRSVYRLLGRQLKGSFLLGIGNEGIEAEASFDQSRFGEGVTIRISPCPGANAQSLLWHHLHPPAQNTGISHIHTTGWKTVAAVAAMLTNKTLEEVRQTLFAMSFTSHGFRPFQDMLSAASGRHWHAYRAVGFGVPMTKLNFPESGAAVLVTRPGAWSMRTSHSHLVAVRGGFVHDPAYKGPLTVGDYSRAGWAAVGIALPEPDSSLS